MLYHRRLNLLLDLDDEKIDGACFSQLIICCRM